MNSEDFIKGVLRTEALIDEEVKVRMNDPKTARLLHAAMGMETEVGEFMDELKKVIFYGKVLDVTNLKEELGDKLYYIGLAIDALGTSFEEVMNMNHAKLKARYGNKFTEDAAKNRDLGTERNILEKNK